MMLSGVLVSKHLNIKIYYFIKSTFLLFLHYMTVKMLYVLFKLCEQVEYIICEFNFRMIKEPSKRFELPRGLWVPPCWEPQVWSVSPPRAPAPRRHDLACQVPSPAPAPGRYSVEASWMKEWWSFPGIVKNLGGGDIYGLSQPSTSRLGNISEFLYLQVPTRMGSLICPDVKKIQGDHRSEDPQQSSWQEAGLRGAE